MTCILIAALLLIFGGAPLHAQAPAFTKSGPIDYLVFVDNSASIKGEPQEIARAATELLVSLADEGDQFVVYTFGERPREIASGIIADEASRDRLRGRIAPGITFAEMRTDITEGLDSLLVVAQRTRRASVPAAAVLVTDGQLIPNYPLPYNPATYPGQVRASYERLKAAALRLRDAGIPVHVIALGTREVNQPAGAGIDRTGGTLLRKDIVEPTGGTYRDASSTDDLVVAYIDLLKNTKGISEISDGAQRFRTDRGTRSVSVVVVKRTASGGVDLVSTDDIVLTDPAGQQVRHADHRRYASEGAQIIWRNQSRYFDVLTIRRPRPGTWSLSEPGLIYAPNDLELAVDASSYPAGTHTGPVASIRERSNGGVHAGDYRLRARVAAADAQSTAELEMERRDDGTYVLPVSRLTQGPAEYALEIIATSPTDSTFYRRSTPLAFRVFAPYLVIDSLVPMRQEAHPTNSATLGLRLDPTVEGYPFDFIERIEALVRTPAGSETVQLQQHPEDHLRYAAEVPLTRAGAYAVEYLIVGRNAAGDPIREQFAGPGLQIDEWWWNRVRPWLAAFVGVLLLGLLAVLGYNLFKGRPPLTNPFARPRLRGQFQSISHPEQQPFRLQGRIVRVGRDGVWFSNASFAFDLEGSTRGPRFRAQEGYFEINELPAHVQELRPDDVVVVEAADGSKYEFRYTRF